MQVDWAATSQSTSWLACVSCCYAELFRRVLAAPILFFLRTPVGDVLNAFARDQASHGILQPLDDLRTYYWHLFRC
jgi:hypothetical protein